MRVLLSLPRAIGNTDGKRGATPTRERQRPPQLLGHHADELQPEGLCVAKIEAFGDTEALFTLPKRCLCVLTLQKLTQLAPEGRHYLEELVIQWSALAA